MADNRADDTKRYSHKNHQRLNIGPEYSGNDNKYADNSQRKGHLERGKGIAHVFLLSLQGDVQARIPRLQLSEKTGPQVGDDFPGIGLLGVNLGADSDPALAVGAGYGGIAGAKINIRHRAQGDHTAIGQADAHAVKIRQPAAFKFCIPDLDPDIILAALEPKGLHAEKTGIDLAGKLFHGQAKGPRFRFQGQAQFIFAGAVIGTDLKNTLIGS